MTTKTKRKALFLDRDGVVNDLIHRGSDYEVSGKKISHTSPHHFHEFKFRDGILNVLKSTKEKGYLTILVTNQPDIAYGLLHKDVHDQIMGEVSKLPLDDIYICFHTRYENCDCKKPKPGMLIQAAQKWGIDLGQSYMLGDMETDMLAGKSAGCTTIFLDNGYTESAIFDIKITDLSQVPHVLKI